MLVECNRLLDSSTLGRIVSSSSISRKRSWSSRVAKVGTGDKVGRWFGVWLLVRCEVLCFPTVVVLDAKSLFNVLLFIRKTASSACSSWEVWIIRLECWCRCFRNVGSSIISPSVSISSLPTLSVSWNRPLMTLGGISNTLLPSGISMTVSSRTGETTFVGSRISSDRMEPVRKQVK